MRLPIVHTPRTGPCDAKRIGDAAMTPRMRVACKYCAAALAAIAMLAPLASAAEIVLPDDRGETIRLPYPAARIVSLAPGLTEMLYAAGAGERLVGTVEFSDFPAAARALPRVGNSASVDPEHIAALRPDLVLAWPHGAGARQVDQLRRLGLPVFVSDPRNLDDIAQALETLGRLAGSEVQARLAARDYRQKLVRLRAIHADAPVLRVFVQIWSNPLMTVNDRHLITDALRICGARNVFGAQQQLAPTVTPEAVVAANPDVILAVAKSADAQKALDAWRKWPRLDAVRRDRLIAVDPDKLSRLTPRAIEGTATLCASLEKARQR